MIVALKVLAVLTFIGYKQTNQQTPNCKYIYRLNDFRYPKDFFQVATSKGYVPKSQLPKSAISQAATSQVCPSHSARPPVCSSRDARPPSPS